MRILKAGNKPAFQHKLAQKTAKYIIKSSRTQNILRQTSYNPSLINSLFVFLLSVTVRPATIMMLPTKEEDKKYSAARSIATGLADLGISAIIYYPINKFLVSTKDILRDHTNSVYHTNKNAFGALNTIINRGSKFVFSPIQIGVLILLMPIIVGKMFNRKCKNENNKSVYKFRTEA